MAPLIEAQSLSDITYLASNPPKYPRNPTERKRQPLTLYIARVPGSKDVILTTLKPQLKNITATDVEASLYYLHLNTEEDAKFLAEAEALKLEENDDKEDIPQPLTRKPLPESTRSSMELHRKPVAAPEPLPDSKSNNKITRKPLAPDQLRTHRPASESKEDPQRRPLGPRPFMSEAFTERKPLHNIDNHPPSSESETPYSMNSNNGNLKDLKETSPIASISQQAFSVTIIRRDPSSAAQWNVGTFVGEEEADRGLTPPQSKKPPYYNILVNITTLGYSQFRDFPSSIEAARLNSSPNPPGNLQTGFGRRIRMEGSNFWDRSKQHKRAHSDNSDAPNTTTRGRSGSTNSPGTTLLNRPFHEDNASQTKGYSFESLWGGRCKFSTSGSGRSLRCSHTLPSPVSASNTTDEGSPSQAAVPISELRFNLPSSTIFQYPLTPNIATKGRSADLGRFYIPKFDQIRNKLSPEKRKPALPPRPRPQMGPPPGSYAAIYPSDDEEPPTLPPRPYSNLNALSSDNDRVDSSLPTTTQLSQQNSRWTSEEEEDDEFRLDLSLGQEKAGGGNRGKRVKLGKLIIFDEGYKMLDLIVAANMGIWWSVRESSA